MAAKGRPFTVRLRADVERRLEEEAGRARRPKTVMLEALADEGLRMRRFPGIGFAGPEHDRRAYLSGTGLEVWEVVDLYRDYGEEGRELMLEAHPVTERQLDVALAYHREYPEEVDRHVRENDRPVEEWLDLHPGVVPPSRLRLILDAHVSGSKVGNVLEEMGHDVKAAEGMEGLPDEALFEMAAREGRVLVTHNVKDFVRILQQRPPEKRHAGLILIPRSVKLNDFGAIISGIQETVSGLPQEGWVDRVEWMKRKTG